jgi:hypothetical protein
MANPARKFDDRPEVNPRANDPYNPASPMDADPVARDPRVAANDPLVNTTVVDRGTGNGVIIAAVLLVLAVVAFFIFGPGVGDDAVVTDQPATTTEEPAVVAPDATLPAPDATAPAAPADPATPAPDATAPEAPADTTAPAPDASAPTEPTDAAPAPAEPAPVEPAPAQ